MSYFCLPETDKIYRFIDTLLIESDSIDRMTVVNQKYYTFVCISDGYVKLTYRGRIYAVEEGDVAVIPPGCPVSYSVDAVSFRGCRILAEICGSECYSAFICPIVIPGQFKEFAEEVIKSAQFDNGRSLTASKNLIITVSSVLSRHSLSKSKLAERVYDCISHDASATLTVSALSERFGVSAEYLSRALVQTFHVGLKSLISEVTADKIMRLTQYEGLNTEEVARRLDFASERNMHIFCRYHGLSGDFFDSRHNDPQANNE